METKENSTFYIEELEKPFEECKAGTNYTVHYAYTKSKVRGQSLIDFNELIWEKYVGEIIDALKSYGIKEFTISCRSTNLIDCLAVFEKFNCKMNGITEVRTGWKRMDGSQETTPALKMEIL